jgi:hypothetical protein
MKILSTSISIEFFFFKKKNVTTYLSGFFWFQFLFLLFLLLLLVLAAKTKRIHTRCDLFCIFSITKRWNSWESSVSSSVSLVVTENQERVGARVGSEPEGGIQRSLAILAVSLFQNWRTGTEASAGVGEDLGFLRGRISGAVLDERPRLYPSIIRRVFSSLFFVFCFLFFVFRFLFFVFHPRFILALSSLRSV